MRDSQVNARKPVDPKDAYILVVEDNVSNFVLIGWGVVDFAKTMNRVDLILMDLRLPHEDGYEALRQVRTSESLRDTLVVVVTAHGSAAEMRKAQEAGFDGFLAKPLDADRFPEQIRKILSGEPVWDLGI
jgi:two-component system cell cycle response regulator DivK